MVNFAYFLFFFSFVVYLFSHLNPGGSRLTSDYEIPHALPISPLGYKRSFVMDIDYLRAFNRVCQSQGGR